MSITKLDYSDTFPFKTIREQQQDALDFCVDAVRSGKRIVVLSLGTGVGKSAIGVTLARKLAKMKLVNSSGSLFLTTQKLLQEQYLRDFGDQVKSIKSSSSFKCKMFKSFKDQHQCTCAEIHRLMRANSYFKVLYAPCVEQCHYRDAKNEFLEAEMGVTNYPYFFSESQYAHQIKRRGLLVCDEAHTLETQLGSFIEITISSRFATKLGVKLPKALDINSVLHWLKNSYKPRLALRIAKLSVLIKDMVDVKQKITSFKNHVSECEVLDKHICKLNRMLGVIDETWILNVTKLQDDNIHLTFKPVVVSTFMKDHILEFGDVILLMSATILDIDVFCRTLGLNRDDVAFMSQPSPFEAKNRPIHYVPVGSMSRKRIDTTLPILCEGIKAILNEHVSQKGIIHAGTYKIAQNIIDVVGDPRLLLHDSQNRHDVLLHHVATSEPTVLVSPSMTEGVDLSDDASRFQILCKVPFPFLGDDFVKRRMDMDPMWYDYKTAMTLVQALGRSIRHSDDTATSYILDSDWGFFFKRNRKLIPQELLDALV